MYWYPGEKTQRWQLGQNSNSPVDLSICGPVVLKAAAKYSPPVARVYETQLYSEPTMLGCLRPVRRVAVGPACGGSAAL